MKNASLCKSILIAEDNDDIRETIEDALKSEGYNVYSSKNGREALETLKTIPGPTLILLDLMMPVMSGWEFMDAQKQNARLASHQHHVVTLSAMPATASIEDQTPLNTQGSLQKPVELEDLLQTVREHCGTV